MKAAPSDPLIGVYTLSQFIYCPRAGLLTYEQRQQELDEDVEDNQPQVDEARLDYLPRWELFKIDRKLSELTDKFRGGVEDLWENAKWQFPVALSLGVVGIWCNIAGYQVGFYCALGTLSLAVPWFCYVSGSLLDTRSKIAELSALRDEAKAAKPREPDPNRPDRESVYWWSLHAAGFDSITYKDSLRDDTWRVSGRPWRVMRRGSLRIPVVRKRVKSPSNRRLYRQHYARIAAYCRLLERCEGGRSPYGIVIFDDGQYQGVAIASNSRGSWVPFRDGLADARRIITDSIKHNRDPEPTPRCCSGCDFGYPRVHRPGKTETTSMGVQLPVFGATGVDGRTYHSVCGDRFRWIPPHSKAYVKELHAR